MKNKFENVMAMRTGRQLQEVIGSPVGYYEPEAVEAAKQEIEKRSRLIRDGALWQCVCGELNDASEKFCQNCALTKEGFIDDDSEDKVESNKQHFAQNEIYRNFEPDTTTPESSLRTIATIIMVCGVIISIVLLIFGIVLIKNYDEITGFTTILSIIPVLLFSIVTWALLRVFSNISINVKEIKEKLNDK